MGVQALLLNLIFILIAVGGAIGYRLFVVEPAQEAAAEARRKELAKKKAEREEKARPAPSFFEDPTTIGERIEDAVGSNPHLVQLSVHPRSVSIDVADGPEPTAVDTWSLDPDDKPRKLRRPPASNRPLRSSCLFRASDLDFTQWSGFMEQAAEKTSTQETSHIIVGNVGCDRRGSITLTVYQKGGGSKFVVFTLDGKVKRVVK